MEASSEKGLDFSAEFGRLHGSSAWCPYSGEMISGGPYLEINLGQIYDICGVEAQGEPGASETTSFTLSYSNDGMAFTDFNSNQVTRYCRICHLCPYMSVTEYVPTKPPARTFIWKGVHARGSLYPLGSKNAIWYLFGCSAWNVSQQMRSRCILDQWAEKKSVSVDLLLSN